jgi:CelD/BcsL family acetyltransferase involved in cellulose biosynthesis
MTELRSAPHDTAAPGGGVWSVETRRGDDGLAGLGAEWDDLAARCSAATPFQSYAWLESWWRAYGRPGTLRLTLVRRDGRLVAAAPLMLRGRAGCPVLTPLGGPLSDFTDVLVDDAVAAPAARVLAEALVAEPGWQAVDVPESRPGAVAGAALWDAWPGGRREVPASVCLELAAVPVDEFLRGLPRPGRKTIRRKLKRVGDTDLDVREVAADDARRAIGDLLDLHARQWRGRGINPEHLSPAFAGHLTRAAGALIASGQAAVIEYRFAGRLRASVLLLIGRDLVGAYLSGAEPTLREHVDVSTMMLPDQLALATRLGRPTLSLLRGEEDYKTRWRPRRVPNRRILLARPGSARGTAYAIGARAARSVVLAAKEHAPWLRTVRDGVRRVLGGRR